MATGIGFKAKALSEAGAHVSKKVAPILEKDIAIILISIRVPRIKRKRWNMAALERDTSLNAIIIEAMDKLLGDDPS